MCGICGQLNFESEHAVGQEVIKRMKLSLAHRGPDDHGIFIKDHVGLGHARLAVIDLSANGHQPMSNEVGTIWITYNGEVYNFQDLRKELKIKGHSFRSNSDTEVIVHLYEEEGIQCMTRLRGMFAFAIWDEDKKQLLLARDRLGQKPLYYYEDEQKLLFASEIKAILASGYLETNPDYEALYQYICLGYVPHPKTGFKFIQKLSPGHRLIVSDGKLSIEPYWSMPNESHHGNIIDMKESYERLTGLLTESTRIRMVSDVPLGVLLSGGIDSSAVATIVSHFVGHVKTFTIGFEDNLYDERNEARFLADKLGTDHQEMVVRPDIADILPKLVRSYDEPFADPSAIPSYYVAQMARRHVKVVLNGDGGDESFAGYGEYIQGLVGRWVEHIPANVGVYISKILNQKRTGKVKSLSQVLALSGRSPARIFSDLRLLIPLIFMDSLLNPGYKKMVGELDPINHLVESYERLDTGDRINTMLAVDRETFLPDDLLFKIDIATMSHSLEARSPFLDHHLVEFVARLPGNLKLKGWEKKHILKESMKGILPDTVLKRKKRGFDVPVGRWIKGELKELCQDIFLGNGLITDIFQKEKLGEMFEDHLSGRKEWGRFFWMLLMLHLWSKAFLGRKPIVY